MDLHQLSTNLELQPSGIWQAKSQSQISYPDHANAWCFEVEAQSFWFQHRNQVILAAVEAFPPQVPICDVGGGNGFVALALQNAGYKTVLIEPGIHGCNNARGRGLETVVCSTLDEAGFASGSFASAGLFDVIEHIEDDTAFLATLGHLLIPKGRLYLTTPAYSWLWSHEDLHAGHFRRYTLASMTHVLKKAGFLIDFASYFFSFLPIPIALFRSLPYRLKRTIINDPEREKQQHTNATGLAGKVVNRIFAAEAGRIRQGKRIPFGGSCLIVARKI